MSRQGRREKTTWQCDLHNLNLAVVEGRNSGISSSGSHCIVLGCLCEERKGELSVGLSVSGLIKSVNLSCTSFCGAEETVHRKGSWEPYIGFNPLLLRPHHRPFKRLQRHCNTKLLRFRSSLSSLFITVSRWRMFLSSMTRLWRIRFI